MYYSFVKGAFIPIVNNINNDVQDMPASAVLFIGESFADIGWMEDGQITASARCYLGRESLSKFLTQFLTERNQTSLGRILVSSRNLIGILKKRHGAQTAFLVTAGFEHWLPLNRPVKQEHFTVMVERAPSILDNSMIFGLSERVSAGGEIEKPLEVSDLEFLAAKLKLHKVEQVAVGLLHSSKNPQHELLAGSFLRDQGFKVHLSHQSADHSFESVKWWGAIVDAYLEPSQIEALKEIRGALETSGHSTAKVFWMTGQGVVDADKVVSANATLFGAPFALNQFRQSQNQQALMYLGFEDFWLLDGRWPDKTEWRAEFGTVAGHYPGFVRCDLQATQLITKGFWGVAGIDESEGGFEPGPMCFGKGLIPQLLDIWYYNDRLENISGLSERLQEKSKSRIGEALIALAREEQNQSRPPSPQEVAIEIEIEAARRLLAHLSVDIRTLSLCGPLAMAALPTLKKEAASLGLEIRHLPAADRLPSILASIVPFLSPEME